MLKVGAHSLVMIMVRIAWAMYSIVLTSTARAALVLVVMAF